MDRLELPARGERQRPRIRDVIRVRPRAPVRGLVLHRDRPAGRLVQPDGEIHGLALVDGRRVGDANGDRLVGGVVDPHRYRAAQEGALGILVPYFVPEGYPLILAVAVRMRPDADALPLVPIVQMEIPIVVRGPGDVRFAVVVDIVPVGPIIDAGVAVDVKDDEPPLSSRHFGSRQDGWPAQSDAVADRPPLVDRQAARVHLHVAAAMHSSMPLMVLAFVGLGVDVRGPDGQ